MTTPETNFFLAAFFTEKLLNIHVAMGFDPKGCQNSFLMGLCHHFKCYFKSQDIFISVKNQK